MKSYINNFETEVTEWQSTKHPYDHENKSIVYWVIYFREDDGVTTVMYRREGDLEHNFLHGYTKEQAIQKFK